MAAVPATWSCVPIRCSTAVAVFAFLAGYCGASVVLMDRWSVAPAFDLMDREGVTVFPGIDARGP